MSKKLDLYDRLLFSDPAKSNEFLSEKGYKIAMKPDVMKKALIHFASINNDHKIEVLKDLHPDYNLILKCEKERKKEKKISADGTTEKPSEEEKTFSTKNVLKVSAIAFGVFALIKIFGD
jgi:hypothetical protein